MTRNSTTTRRIGAGIGAGLIASAALLGAAPAFAANSTPPPAPAHAVKADKPVKTDGMCVVPEGSASILRGPVVMKIKNNTDSTLRVRICGTYGAGLKDQNVQPGETLTGSGQTKERVDLMANVVYPDGQKVDTWGGNPTIGKPWIGFGNTYGDNWERFGVGDAKSFRQDGHSFQVVRDDDQGNNSKWFQINVNS